MIRRSTAAVVFSLAILAGSLPPPVAGADPATPTPTGTTVVTPEPTDRPTRTPNPTAPPRPTPTLVQVIRSGEHHRHPTRTPTPIPRLGRKHHRRHHHHHRRSGAAARATRTPRATPTPAVSLQTDNSVLPVSCNGSGKPVASRPFLTPPYRGWTSIVSYFDHDMPTYAQDGIIVTASGVEAQPDSTHHASDFPAYWSPTLRQYLYYDGHNGYDYDLWYQPVYAAAAGKVLFAAFEYPTLPDHGYGKMVLIDHHNGYVTLYGHFSRLLVHRGQRVHRGQEIGISGNTGHSSGPHLHFSVFHNCSPTDPYGWSGSGPDPLQGFQGETSTYLWRRQPLVANPQNHWPGLDSMPPTTASRIALLHLPTTSYGSAWFRRALTREADRAARSLRKHGLSAAVDLLRGAVLVGGKGTAQSVYAAPDVVSITTPDTVEGARTDVLSALASAALHDRHARLQVGRSTAWNGYLMRWQGRAFLVGRGIRGRQADIRLQARGRRAGVHTVQTDPKTGAYAIDLGRMSDRQMASVQRELEGKGSGGPAVSVRPARNATSVSTSHRGSSPPYAPIGALIVVLLALGVVVGKRYVPRIAHER